MPDLYGHLTPQGVLNGSLQTIVYVNNYNDLINKPSINSVELQGNKTAADLGLLTEGDIPVESVNGKQGVVELDGTDINYSLTKTLNQKIDEVAASIPVVSYPVTSVNTKTGDVVLDGDDIDYAEGVTVNDQIGSNTADIGTNTANIGSLSQLTTTDKSSLVGAVNEIATYTPVYGNTASGAIATFDTSLALPLQDCTIDINAVQESGTPTPSSPKAISGFTGANIHVADDETPHVIDNVTAIIWQSEAGTVYGGSLDVTTGLLTVTHLETLIKNVSWIKSTSSNKRFYTTSVSSAIKRPPTQRDVGKCLCEIASIISANYLYSNHDGIAINNNGDIWLYFNDYVDKTEEEMITDLGDYKIVYELATPVIYQLTPTQISAIVGTNNVFTDTNGNTSVVYACSLKDYIDGQ